MRTNGGCRCNQNYPLEVKHFGLRLKTFTEHLLNEKD